MFVSSSQLTMPPFSQFQPVLLVSFNFVSLCSAAHAGLWCRGINAKRILWTVRPALWALVVSILVFSALNGLQSLTLTARWVDLGMACKEFRPPRSGSATLSVPCRSQKVLSSSQKARGPSCYCPTIVTPDRSLRELVALVLAFCNRIAYTGVFSILLFIGLTRFQYGGFLPSLLLECAPVKPLPGFICLVGPGLPQ